MSLINLGLALKNKDFYHPYYAQFYCYFISAFGMMAKLQHTPQDIHQTRFEPTPKSGKIFGKKTSK